jgi:hypothetical protein
MSKGFVYVLISANSEFVKIGGTEQPLRDRLRGINGTPSYADHGPWELSDFLQVTDWRLVEGHLHRHFVKSNVKDAAGTRELFRIPPNLAREQLRLVSPVLRVGHEKTGQLFAADDVRLFLYRLFQLSGLFGNLDIQGAWTLSLSPSTSRGRWFTINIGPHEVAFSQRRPVNGKFEHFLILDRLILDYPETVIWIGKHGGAVNVALYATAQRAVSVEFWADFAESEKVFKLPGVRRALVAYWSERLADLRERNAKSVFARFHSYDAVSRLLEYKRAADKVL